MDWFTLPRLNHLNRTMDKTLIQTEFGANAAAYVDSVPHAKGASLGRLVALLAPQPEWQVLDVATGSGHTAFALAPFVAQVWATDITAEMRETAVALAQSRGLTNIRVEYADAEALPYAGEMFDLVTCRIAAHHFGDIRPFLQQSVRVLKPGGRLAVVDNVVPAGQVGDYVNAFEKLRDPSHGRCLSLTEWQQAFQAHGLTLRHSETLDKQMNFGKWAARHHPTMQAYLQALLFQGGPEVLAFLQPQTTGTDITFRLREGILIGEKTAD